MTEDQIDALVPLPNGTDPERSAGRFFTAVQVLEHTRAAVRAALSSASSGAVLTDAEPAYWVAQFMSENSGWCALGQPTPSRENAERACSVAMDGVETRVVPLYSAILAATQRAEPVAQSVVGGLREALESIAANTCCDRCQEAALVARAALNAAPPADPVDVDANTHPARHWLCQIAASKRYDPNQARTGRPGNFVTLNVPRFTLEQIDLLLSRPAAPLSEGPRDDGPLAAAIHWPECWDTAAYPTARHALEEVHEHFRCTTCSTSPQPTDEATDAGRRSFTLTAHQLAQALEFADGIPAAPQEPDIAETPIAFGYLSDVKDDDGEDLPAGLFCWLADYPEEGYHGPLDETPPDDSARLASPSTSGGTEGPG